MKRNLLWILFFLSLTYFSYRHTCPPTPTSAPWDQPSKLLPCFHSWPTWIHIYHICHSHISEAQIVKFKFLILSFKVLCHLDTEFLSSFFSFIDYHKNLPVFFQIFRIFHSSLLLFMLELLPRMFLTFLVLGYSLKAQNRCHFFCGALYVKYT